MWYSVLPCPKWVDWNDCSTVADRPSCKGSANWVQMMPGSLLTKCCRSSRLSGCCVRSLFLDLEAHTWQVDLHPLYPQTFEFLNAVYVYSTCTSGQALERPGQKKLCIWLVPFFNCSINSKIGWITLDINSGHRVLHILHCRRGSWFVNGLCHTWSNTRGWMMLYVWR